MTLHRPGAMADDTTPSKPFTAARDGFSVNAAVGCEARMRSKLERVFGIDISTGPKCGGKLRVIGEVTDPNVIARILEHVEARERHERDPHAPPVLLAG